MSLSMLVVIVIALVAIVAVRQSTRPPVGAEGPAASMGQVTTDVGATTAASVDVVPSAATTTSSAVSGPVFPFAAACAGQSFSPRQCDAIIDEAMDEAGVGPADLAAVEFLPFERVQTLGGGQVALVRLHLVVGTVIDQDVHCVGVSFRPACNDVAEIMVHDGVDHDIPCAGEPPAGCATQPPTPGPHAVGAATPFRLDAIDIPIDRRGTYEVRIGAATLPDGYLSERSFRLAEPRPTTFWINDGVFMDLRPEVDGRPFVGSIYRDPFDGPEPVSIFLVFEVSHLEAPSLLEVRDIVVR